MISIGIDPGRWGALAVLINGAPVDAWPLEQISFKLKNGKTRYAPNGKWLIEKIEAIRRMYPGDCINMYVEDLKKGAQGNGGFNFGKNYGYILGIVYSLKYRKVINDAQFVPVERWKNHFNLMSERRAPGAARKAGAEKKALKQKSIDKVMELWPVFDINKFRNFETRSGVADAILIAASQS